MTEHIQAHDFVASLQNGVVKDELLVNVFGREKVVGGLAVVAGERPVPGTVNWTYDGGTQFGELDGVHQDVLTRLWGFFNGRGLSRNPPTLFCPLRGQRWWVGFPSDCLLPSPDRAMLASFLTDSLPQSILAWSENFRHWLQRKGFL